MTSRPFVGINDYPDASAGNSEEFRREMLFEDQRITFDFITFVILFIFLYAKTWRDLCGMVMCATL